MAGEPTWWDSFEKLLDQRFGSLDREFASIQKALELQAKEYERRLNDLNHAHEEALRVQHTFVSLDKWEDKMESESEARKIALDRLDERIASVHKSLNDKLDGYITKAEARQMEIEQSIANQQGAAEEAQRAAEEQGRVSKELVEKQTRKVNRNMALAGLALTAIIALSNFVWS